MQTEAGSRGEGKVVGVQPARHFRRFYGYSWPPSEDPGRAVIFG
jgi:hypothetical protein